MAESETAKKGLRQTVLSSLRGNPTAIIIGDSLRTYMTEMKIPVDHSHAMQLVAVKLFNDCGVPLVYNIQNDYSKLIESLIQTNQLNHLMRFYQMYACVDPTVLTRIMTPNELCESLIGPSK